MTTFGEKFASVVFASGISNTLNVSRNTKEPMNIEMPNYLADVIQNAILDLTGANGTTEVKPLEDNLMSWHKILKIGVSDVDPNKVLGINITRTPLGDVSCGTKLFPHERHQLLDSRCGKLGIPYGILTFSAKVKFETKGGQRAIPGKLGIEEMLSQLTGLVNRGWIDKEGCAWKCIYAHYHDEGFMVFIPKTATEIKTIYDLGITVMNDAKAMKYAKRVLASHPGGMIEGTYVSDYSVSNGYVYVHRLNNGELIQTLNYDMSLLSPEEVKVVDGKILSNLKGYTDCALTVFGQFGLGKGIASPNDNVEYDIIIYGSKHKVMLSGGDKSIYIGKISDVAAHPLVMDSQTMVNAGFYEENLSPRLGINHLDELARAIFSSGEYQLRELVAGFVRSQDARWTPGGSEWPIVRALKSDIGLRTMPVLIRRLVKIVMEGSKDVAIGRVPMKGAGIRVYVRDNPALTNADGSLTLSEDKMVEDRKADPSGLHYVCIPDAPQGEVLIYRNPNTTSREMMIVYNYHYPELMKYVGQGWAFLGADAGEILDPLNGGDMDDNIGVIWDTQFLGKWDTMSYPVVARIEEASEYVPLVTEHAKKNIKVWKEGSSVWNFKTFHDQLQVMTAFGVSLGVFINRGMLDSLLSGEHKEIALKSLHNRTCVFPEGFKAPSLGDLDELLGKGIIDVEQEYVPTAEGFVNMAIQWLEARPNYMASRAMTNSDKIIDWTVAHKGNKSIVDELVIEAAMVEDTPVFPISYASRIPAKRKLAGDYILVPTKQCEALSKLRAYRDGIFAEVKKFEFLLAKTMPKALNDIYPEDEGLREMMLAIRGWWNRNLQEARVDGILTPEGYSRVANGWDEKISTDSLDGKSEETIHHIGLLDLFTYQVVEINADQVTLSDQKWSSEVGVKFAISWLNHVYSRKIDLEQTEGRSFSDGVPNWMLNLVFDGLEERGLTGQVEFLNLNHWAKDNILEPVIIRAKKDGMCVLKSNGRRITSKPCWTLPDGEYVMSPAGVVVVEEADPELHSDWKSNQVATISAGAFPVDMERTSSISHWN
jgi:hypothetical protein